MRAFVILTIAVLVAIGIGVGIEATQPTPTAQKVSTSDQLVCTAANQISARGITNTLYFGVTKQEFLAITRNGHFSRDARLRDGVFEFQGAFDSVYKKYVEKGIAKIEAACKALSLGRS